MGTVGFYRLPSDWVALSFQKALSETIGPSQVELPKIQVRWGGWQHPLGIDIEQVTIIKPEQELKLQIPNLLFSLKLLPLLWGKAEIGRCTFNSANIYIKDQLMGNVSAKIKLRNKKFTVKADFHRLDATGVIHFILQRKQPDQVSFPFKGTLILEGSHSKGIDHIDLSCSSQGGVLIIPEIYPSPLKFETTQFVVMGNSQKLSLKKFNIKQGNSSLTVRGSAHSPISWKQVYESGAKLDVSLEGKIIDVPVDNLKFLWPHGLSPKPRNWVVNQLSQGKADEAIAAMRGLLTLQSGLILKSFEIPHIEGHIAASNVTVDYFGKLPPATNVKGKCTFTREKFYINAVGHAHDIQLKTANIIIHDLHVKDQTIDIDLDLEGAVRNSLEIINAQPLFLAKKLDLDPSRISGKASTKVHLNFPLETIVPLEMIKVDASSRIADGKIVYEAKIEGEPLTLDRGMFDLKVTQKSLEMKGNAYIQDVPTLIQWQEFFRGEKIPFLRQFNLKGDVNLKKLRNFGFDASDYLEGNALTNITYKINPQMQSEIEVLVDLTPSIIVSPILFWQKDKEEPAHLRVFLRKDSAEPSFRLHNATLEGPNLKLVMNGMDHSFQKWEIQHLQIGNSHVKSQVERQADGSYQVNVKGKVVDLSHILDDTTPEPLIKPTSQDRDFQTQTKLILNLDEVILGKSNSIHKVTGEMKYHGHTLGWANLKGKPPQNDGQISLHLTPVNSEQEQFRLHSDDGGHLLEMLGADYNLEGGTLTINGIKKEKILSDAEANHIGHKKSWEISGDITIDDFNVNKAPLLARLLSATSFHNIINFFSGRGINFSSGEAEFVLTPTVVKINKMKLVSPSLGLLLNGSIDRLRHQVNFSGELIPLYLINTVLARIPLLGDWISGGKEDGVFMTYFTLTGDRRDPVLAINPITTVTPGLVREMFKPQENKP
jgi:hypothetical protein